MEETPLPGVEDAAPVEKPVRRRRRKTRAKQIDWFERVPVRNLTKRLISTRSGSVKPGEVGHMSRLDADRMRRYVEIVDDA